MHHTVSALGADCSASCAGFSLTDLLPLATGHWPRGFWPFGQIRFCTAFPWSPFPLSAVHADGGKAEGPSRPGRTPVGLEQLRVVAAELFALPLNRCHYCA